MEAGGATRVCSGRLVRVPVASPSVRQRPMSQSLDHSWQPLRRRQSNFHSASRAQSGPNVESSLQLLRRSHTDCQCWRNQGNLSNVCAYQRLVPSRAPHSCRAACSADSQTSTLTSPDHLHESPVESHSEGRRIWFSDVIGHKKQNRFLHRSWGPRDIIVVATFLLMHGGCLLAPSTFSWDALGVAVMLYFVTGCLGITLSFHRNLAHKSFKLPKALEYLFAYCAVQAVQSGPLQWVSLHRQHHLYTDTELDPHSPAETFWHAHIGWSMDEKTREPRGGNFVHVADLQSDPYYVLLESTYLVHPLLLSAALYAWGGLPYLVWGMAVRLVWMWHWTFSVNSAAHVWGTRPWNTGDTSRNNWWVALITYGEGWHNNHHAFQYSARHGLEWWQYDITWYIICLLEKLGLATDVKLPRPEHVARMKAIS